MRIFTIAQILLFTELAVVSLREGLALPLTVNGTQIIGNGAVIAGGVFEGLDCQGETVCRRHTALMFCHRLKHLFIIIAIDHNGDGGMILGGGAHHRGAADIDIFDGLRQSAVRIADGMCKGIQVDGYQVDSTDAMLIHDGIIDTPSTQDTAVDLGVQGFQAAVHHLREGSIIRDFDDRNSLLFQQPSGAAGGEYLNVHLVQAAGKIDNAAFVRDAD